jgi:hypothetical protein
MTRQAQRARILKASMGEPHFPAPDAEVERSAARRHLDSLPAERRAQLEREWIEAENAAWPPPRPTPELIARANAEWKELS